MGKDKFLKGALILTIAGLLVKVIGSVNRILLSRLLGGEGIGLYQMAYPVYLLMLSICSAGVPVAVSIIVAEKVAKNDYAQAHRIFKVTLGLMAVFGLAFAITLYGLAGFLISSGWIRDSRAYYALAVLTPAVFFSSILASFRGYFQGYQMMTPPAVSQILEQLVRVITMIGLACVLLPRGLEYAAAGAAFGAVPGGLTGLLVLTWFYRKARKEWKKKIREQSASVGESVSSIAKRLFLLAVPVSCANLLIPVTSSIDMLLVPNALGRAGFGVEAATTLFGYLTGMAQPLLMMATIPSLSLAASLVPAVSEAFTLKHPDEILRKTKYALKICMLLTIPASVGMWALSDPISGTLYGTMKAAPVIAHLAPSIMCLGMFQVTTGALQGIGKTAVPMWNMLLGAVVKAWAVWQLASVPVFHILGAAWASNLNFALVAVINIVFLYRNGIPFPVLDGLKILAASVCMGAGGKAASLFFMAQGRTVTALVVGMAVAVVIYIAAVIILRCLDKEETRELPVIGKFFRR